MIFSPTRYIAYCRSKCRPRLSAAAAELLKNRYVSFRTTMRDQKKQNNSAKAIPITVRQQKEKHISEAKLCVMRHVAKTTWFFVSV